MANRALDWLNQGGHDLQHARNSLSAGDFDWACFAAHQAAEKAVKALVQHKGGEGWGHAVTRLLMDLAARFTIPDEVLLAARRLDKHYIPTRYPTGLTVARPAIIIPRAKRGRRLPMPKPFITFVATRFVNREAVVAALGKCARRLAEELPAAEVRLFGSYAAGTPTPRSDADIAVIVPDDFPVPVSRVKEMAENIFLEAPVPVEVFVLPRSAFAEGQASGWGLAGAVARDGFSLVQAANSG